MKKDETIIKFIERLKLVLNFTLLEIVDYWEADLCAVGLKNGNRLVYISTFNYVEEDEPAYDFDLELLDQNSRNRIEIIKEGRRVSESELIDEVKVFLGG